MANTANPQQDFWARTYSDEYIAKNNSFDAQLGIEAWSRMLAATEAVGSILECGCNIGRNISFLDELLPDASKSIIEISEPAFRFVSERYTLDQKYHGSIVEAEFERASFDLVFTTGVLIHIHPDDLLANMRKMFEFSQRYVLIGEYFNRTPVMIKYQGEQDRLFKSDFGKTFVTNFDVDVVDYGFLWGHEFDAAGFDDVTWWLFEKR